jgi:hypothetical protein
MKNEALNQQVQVEKDIEWRPVANLGLVSRKAGLVRSESRYLKAVVRW